MENIDNATAVSRVTQQRARRFPLGAVWRVLRAMIRAARTRRELARMDQHMWSDIGISRGEALTESTRKFWDLTTPADPSRRSRGD